MNGRCSVLDGAFGHLTNASSLGAHAVCAMDGQGTALIMDGEDLTASCGATPGRSRPLDR